MYSSFQNAGERLTIEALVIRPHQSQALNSHLFNILIKFDHEYKRLIGELDTPAYHTERRKFAERVAHDLVKSYQHDERTIQVIESQYRHTIDGKDLHITQISAFSANDPAPMTFEKN